MARKPKHKMEAILCKIQYVLKKEKKKNPETGILKHYLYNKKQVLADAFAAEGPGCSLLSLILLSAFQVMMVTTCLGK